ncbi:MAG: class I SAM-dependent methyltransferase [Clostridia bacterium]|nr:class I SAM-dependent methyltransferase [Clostridia bacterium]
MKATNCPVCSSVETEIRFINLGKYNIVKCNKCTYHFTLPVPTTEELDQYYKAQSIFFVGSGVDTFEGYLLNPLPYRERYLNRVKRLKEFKSTGQLLDIGCAGGIFLDCARDSGFTVEGVEPSETGIELCKKLGLSVQKGFFLNMKFDSQYDIITMYDVLEHTLYPKEEVSKVYSMLKPEGIFVITLPNIDSLLARLHGSKWDMIGFPEHLNYFTPKSLSLLLKNNGFEILSVRTFNGEPNYTILVLIKGVLRAMGFFSDKKTAVNNADSSAQTNSNNPPLPIPLWKQSIKKSLILLRPLIYLLPIFNVGEGLEIIAQKANHNGKVN